MEKDSKNVKKTMNIRLTEHSTSTSLNGAVKIRFGDSGIAAIKPVTITEFFQNCCERYALSPALAFKTLTRRSNEKFHENNWTTLTHKDYMLKVQQAAKVLIYIGLKPRMAVGILANNCPEWFFMQFGILQAGGIAFGIYPSSSAEAVYHMLAITEAAICIVGNAEQLEKVRAVRARLPKLRVILQLHGPQRDFKYIEPGYFCWSELIRLKFNKEFNKELKRREQKQFANECAMIVFTSGAVGMPKAALLSHDNIIYNVKAVYNSQQDVVWGEGRVVSYLPLSNISAQAFEIFAALFTGACVYFADDNALKGTLVSTLREVKPTMFLGVPRIYQKLQDRLLAEHRRKGTFSKYVEKRARSAVNLNNICEANCSVPVSIKDTFANYIIDNTRKVIGMENCKLFFCGGAALSSKIKEFFSNFDVRVIDGYSLSELSGPAIMNRSQGKLRSVGKPIDGTELQIRKQLCTDQQGEILFYGRHVFMGYLKDPKKTAAAIDGEGWFHTGSLGYLDHEDYLVNCGRIREIIITAGGEIVAPVPIEEALKQQLPALSNAMIVGDKRKYLTVLLAFKTDIEPSIGLPTDFLHADTIAWLRSIKLNFTKLSSVLDALKDKKKSEIASKITRSIMKVIDLVNKRALSNSQRIRKFLLLRHDFSVATGELGPSLKVRRSVVLKKYAKKIDEMYC